MATLEDLIRQKQELEKEIEEVTRRERINAINTCRELIQKFDLQPAEIGLIKLAQRRNDPEIHGTQRRNLDGARPQTYLAPAG